MGSPPLVIGIGNEYRGDDGVGLAVVRALQSVDLTDGRLMESDGNCTTLLDAWKNVSKVILIDAVSSGAEPGTISRFDAHAQRIPATCAFSSTHAFGIVETLALACTLNQIPPSVIIYGIEGENFATGDNLSKAVRKAVQQVVTQVIYDVDEEKNHA
jgi:hydrogenase maturation protease